MVSISQPEYGVLRDPDEFEDDLEEERTPLSIPDPLALQTPSRSTLHRRSGANLSVSSMSIKKTAFGIGRRTLGLCLMLVTISMWTTSNFLASSIFADGEYSKPFFVTWLNVGFFSIFLLKPLMKRALRGTGYLSEWTRQRTSEPVYSPVATSNGRLPIKPDDVNGDSDHRGSLQSSRESLILDESMVLSSHGFKNEESEDFTLYDTARLGLTFFSLWFASNYFISACLQYTTVASSTVISSTSSAFTLAFGALVGAEKFTIRKLVSVAVSLLGVVLISQVDLSGESDENRGSFPEKSTFEMAIGDILALASAMGYGVYTILLKKRVNDESRMDVFTFFGFVGLFDLVLLWPGMLILHWTGIETFQAPPDSKVWWIIIINGFISVISDVCWTYSMLLTSPLVITVGLSLAIPMSLLGQMVLNGQNSSVLYWIGSVIVAVSFFIVNQENKREAAETDMAIVSATLAPAIMVEDDELEDEDGNVAGQVGEEHALR